MTVVPRTAGGRRRRHSGAGGGLHRGASRCHACLGEASLASALTGMHPEWRLVGEDPWRQPRVRLDRTSSQPWTSSEYDLPGVFDDGGSTAIRRSMLTIRTSSPASAGDTPLSSTRLPWYHTKVAR